MKAKDYEKAFEDNPVKAGRKLLLKIILVFIFIGVIVSVIGWGLGWFREAGQVAREEFGAREALRKYEWFKDASAQLEKKRADISVYQQDIISMKEDYSDVQRKDWDRTDKEQYNQWRREVAGIKAGYNQLVAEYNSSSSKFNWKPFKGDIPETYETFKIN